MGQDRMENYFKDKLGQREIKPIVNSWDKLKLKLDKEEKRPRPVIWWMGIAASLLGGILIAGLVYFEGPQAGPVLVDTPGLEIIPSEDDKEEFIKPDIASGENKLLEIKPVGTSAEKEKIQISPRKDINENTLAGQNKPGNFPEVRQVTPKIQELKEDKLLSQKLEEIIAEAGQVDNEDALSLEIDALLQKAAKEISLEKQNSQISAQVDARGLLYDVEMELEQSFREKVFDVLKEGYLKARTAVVNRNLQ